MPTSLTFRSTGLEVEDDIHEAADDELLEDLAPDSDEAADVQGGWRYRQEEPEEEELQM